LQKELAAVRPLSLRTPVAAGAAAVLALCAATYFFLHRAPKLTARDTIVLADFENKTGDPVFDQTLRQGLAVQLEQSPFLKLASDQSIKQALHLMDRPAETQLTPEIAREICERTGSAAVLEGSIAPLGRQYIVWLRARNCSSGDAVAEAQEPAGTKEQVLTALSHVALQIRNRLGESLATIQEHSTPLEQATTSSLEALKAYSAARRALFAYGSGFPSAIPHLQRAIAIDPQFAMAHADLGFFSWNTGQTDLGAEETRKAYALRDRVSDRERYYILMLYDRQVTGNLQKELHTLEAWVQTYPRDINALTITGGWAAFGTGQYGRGIQAGETAIRVDPDMPFGYTVAAHYLLLDRYTEAAGALERAAARKLELPEMLVTRYYLAFLTGDQAGMDREIARAPAEHSEDAMLHHRALVAAHSGRMREARTLWARAIALSQQDGRRETTALYEAAQAVCEAHFGNAAAARTGARSALDLAKGRDVEYAAAFALALSGDPAAPQRLAGDLAKRFPEDTPVQFEYLPTLHALFALSRKAPLDAIARLETALPYDLAMPGTAFFAKFGGLYTAYVRGQAYLQADRGREAASEFQKILDHRGIVVADPVGALAYLQLGRANVVSGDRIKAKSAYRDFLTLWKDADPDIPILKNARAEYAKL
jgi:tetratricopeptide (TPR) repeat protein